ncbi:MAG: glycosyltransferase family 2 protein, partial [Ilumatobacteraceae bacterium]
MNRVSIVIPVYDGATLTQRCLDTLIAQSLDAEIVVVDDASADETELLLSCYGDKINVVRNEFNCGYSVSCNVGVAASSGELVVLLNNDTEPLDGWLDALVGYADDNPQASIIGTKLLYPDGRIQHAGVAFGSSGWPYHLYCGFPGDHPATNRARRFQVVTAACMLVRRELFDELGGFDEGFVNSAEDVDLCLRAGQLGAQVHYCPDSRIIHM